MTDLLSRQQKIQEKRQQTPWREFVKQIVSRCPVVFHRTQGEMSRYPQSERVGTIIANKSFDEQRDTLLSYGFPYDPSQGFFKQFQTLLKAIPLGATIRQMAGDNTLYADSVVGSSNAYLSSIIINDCTNVLYSFIVFDYCKDIIDSVRVGTYSEQVYRSVGVIRSTKVFYSRYITNSSDMRFSSNMIGCHHCILCDGLENASYCIGNKQLTKEAFFAQKAELMSQKELFETRYAALNRTSLNYGSQQTTGNHNIMSTNLENCFFTNRLSGGRNAICVGGENLEENFIDVFDGGVGSYNMIANEGTGSHSHDVYCSSQIEHCSFVFYSYYLINCHHCLGCVGLQNKQFCIFNKQYTEDSRHEMVQQIFTDMDHQGVLGEFFPSRLNPFYFNDTVANLITDDFSQEEIVRDGYLWRDEVIKVDVPERMETVGVAELGQYERWKDGVRTIDPSLLKKVIRDGEGNVYRVIKMEYDFLMKHELPLPKQHWMSGLKQQFKLQ